MCEYHCMSTLQCENSYNEANVNGHATTNYSLIIDKVLLGYTLLHLRSLPPLVAASQNLASFKPNLIWPDHCNDPHPIERRH